MKATVENPEVVEGVNHVVLTPMGNGVYHLNIDTGWKWPKYFIMSNYEVNIYHNEPFVGPYTKVTLIPETTTDRRVLKRSIMLAHGERYGPSIFLIPHFRTDKVYEQRLLWEPPKRKRKVTPAKRKKR